MNTLTVQGRVTSVRGQGRVIFMDILDEVEDEIIEFRLLIRRKDVGGDVFGRCEQIKPGDIVSTAGAFGRCKRGLAVVFVQSLVRRRESK